MARAAKFETKFIKKEKESKDAYTFYFERPPKFDFIPGQYLKIFLNIPNSDDRGSSRYFTISSSSLEKEYLSITTRIIKSSFKLRLNSLNSGDRVTLFGPIGYFDFYPEKQKKVIFIAGGIGVTPFHCILKTFDFNREKTNIVLFNSFDYKENVVFYDEFKKIEIKNSEIKFIYTLTQDKKYYPGFEKGRINEEMIKKYVNDLSGVYFFITGTELMVNSMFELIKKMGVSEEKIFKEDFPGY